MTGLFLISHGSVGEAMLDMAVEILGKRAMPVSCLAIAKDDEPAELFVRAQQIIKELDVDNVIILTDLYGATPSNIAARLIKEDDHLMMITGMNIPMLIRLLNYANENIANLITKGIDGGRKGIFVYDPEYDD